MMADSGIAPDMTSFRALAKARARARARMQRAFEPFCL